ncbi:putative carotenoid cleavage dioxygenase 4, chloroplastic [Senna tora]|uniref:Putative carotenoid cleavage dioxygenase 4, chloroplastic n=1 Tax=Senna tora TaxID=362788 RepID=A0A834STL7_9FABA|nr:putative carotenoid cleavage dioxygenase 4, chloroplastic [Senna tora]
MEMVAPVSLKPAPILPPQTHLNLNYDQTKIHSTLSPSHNLSLLLPPKPQNLPLHPISTISSQPLNPQITTYSTFHYCRNKHKTAKGYAPKPTTTSDILRLMDGLAFSIPIDIYTILIEECTVSGDPNTAMELFTHITQSGIIKPPLTLLNRLLVMFVSCGLVEHAHHLFDKMSVRDFNSWATLIVAYFNDSNYEEAIGLFLGMIHQVGMLELPKWVLLCLLKACGCTMNLGLGKQIHGWLFKFNMCDDVLITSSLIQFYGKFKCVEDANLVFKLVSRHNTFTWTAKIVNDCRKMHFSDVLSDFKEMGRQGIRKNSFTLSSVLKACGRMLSHGHCGQQVHANAIKLGLVSDSYVECGLIDMYGRSGLVREAKMVFEMIRDRTNIACWNAMLMGYIQNGLYIEAIKFLYQMNAAGVQPQESLLNEVHSRFALRWLNRRGPSDSSRAEPVVIKKRRPQVQSLPAFIFNSFDTIINTFIDPPIKPSVDPKHVLSNNFAPVDELPPTECEIIHGSLPPSLDGAYIRNGPNPQFLPRGPYHLFDGDGMLHCLRISQGKPTLSSRYVKTYKYTIENEAGYAIIPNVFSGFNGLVASAARGSVTAARVLAGQYNPANGIGLANTSLALFGNRLFALGESDLPYEIKLTPNGDVQTLGRHDFEGKLFMSMTAHPKVDADTGETFAFRYGPVPPFLTYFRFDSNGVKQTDVPVFSMTRPSFLHDFAITKNYAVFADIQIGMNPVEMLAGGSPVGSDPSKVSRIGVLPSIVLIAPNILSVEHTLERMELVHAMVEKVKIDLKTGIVRRQPISARNLDFAKGESKFLVMDAKSPELEVVAEVRLPRRVPYGFHGLFVRESDIMKLS